MKNKKPSISMAIIIGIFILVGSSCSQKYLKGTIYMGNGGGFAGNWKEYQLNANGDLYFRESIKDSVVFIKTLDSSATKRVFRKYYKLKLDRDNFDAPGNMYYYVGKREGKFRNHKITFGNPEAGVSKELKNYYDDFMDNLDDSTKVK
jgi:hypothetical protein